MKLSSFFKVGGLTTCSIRQASLSAIAGLIFKIPARKLKRPLKKWDEYRIKLIIDIRHMWKDGEKIRPLSEEKVDNIVYDEGGKIYCHCPLEDICREMAYRGYEDKRKSLKYRCPAQSYGYECRGKDSCHQSRSTYGRIVRISLSRDRRMFVPAARSSYAWKRAYKQRTATL